jgi:hypothetical protein
MAMFATSATLGRRQPVAAPRFAVPGAMGDMGPLGMVCHHYGSRRGMLTPIQCQKFDSGLRLLCSW